MSYFGRMRGGGQSPPRVGLGEVVWSWLGSMVGVAAVALLHAGILDPQGLTLLTGSFGASAALLFGAPRSPMAQPRNLVGGHVLSAAVGVSAQQLVGGHLWLAAALAVSGAVALMHLTRTLHPPGGATALFAVIGGESIHRLGYLYAIIPTALDASVMLLIALIINNIPRTRKYPEYWF